MQSQDKTREDKRGEEKRTLWQHARASRAESGTIGWRRAAPSIALHSIPFICIVRRGATRRASATGLTLEWGWGSAAALRSAPLLSSPLHSSLQISRAQNRYSLRATRIGTRNAAIRFGFSCDSSLSCPLVSSLLVSSPQSSILVLHCQTTDGTEWRGEERSGEDTRILTTAQHNRCRITVELCALHFRAEACDSLTQCARCVRVARLVSSVVSSRLVSFRFVSSEARPLHSSPLCAAASRPPPNAFGTE